jgi:hypothetical protein
MAAVAVGAGCWWSRGRLAVRIATVGVLVAVGVYVVVEQHRHRYLPTIDWPADLSSANDLAWLGITLLGADVVVGAIRSRLGVASTLGPGHGRMRRAQQ